jgi:hypothetical protein
LRESGLSVIRYADLYGERVVTDDEWISYVASQQLVALSNDRNIRSDPIAIKSAMESGARLFIVRGKNLSSAEKANLVIGAVSGIVRVLTEQSAPFIAVVSRHSLPRGVVKPEVRVRLTFAEWSRGKVLPADIEEDLPL